MIQRVPPGQILLDSRPAQQAVQRVMEKLSMTREGVLPSHIKGRRERIDVVYYGLLREEWERIPKG